MNSKAILDDATSKSVSVNKKAPKIKAGKVKVGVIVTYVILSIIAIIWVFPIFSLIMDSFRVEKGPLISSFLPSNWTFANYINLFNGSSPHVKFARWYLNTLVVSIATCVVSTIFVLFVSYALARFRFKFRKKLMNVALILGMFPGFMSMIAIYYILKAMNLTETLFALVLAYSAGSGLTYYIVKGFFDTIPRALDEAATIDGASKNVIFWKIILPLSKPIMIYTIILTFMVPWADFLLVSIIIRDNVDNYTVSLGLYKMLEREMIYQYYTQFAAGAVIIAITVTSVFIVFQRYYVAGVTGGAVKG